MKVCSFKDSLLDASKKTGTGNDKNQRKKRLKQLSQMLLPPPSGATQELKELMSSQKEVMSSQNKDKIHLIAKHDNLIMRLGSKLVHLHGHQRHLHVHVTQKMRQIARFLQEARKLSKSIITLRDCLDPANFALVTKAAREMAGFLSESVQKY